MQIVQKIKGQYIIGFNEPKISGKLIEAILKNPHLSEIEEVLREEVNSKSTKLRVLSELRRKLQSQEVIPDEQLDEINKYAKQITDLRKELENIRGPQPQPSDYKKIKVRVIRILTIVEHQIVNELIPTNKVLHLVEIVGKLPKKFREKELNKTSESEE